MITSKQIIEISEDWISSPKLSGGRVDLFVNPGSSDILELVKKIKGNKKEIRFIVDARGNGKVYVWDAMLAIHEEVLPFIGLSGSHVSLEPHTMFGYGYIQNGRIVSHNLDEFPRSLRRWIDGIVGLNDKRLLDPSIRSVIKRDSGQLTSKFNYSWSFVDRWIGGGLNQYIEIQKKRFLDWKKIHDNI